MGAPFPLRVRPNDRNFVSRESQKFCPAEITKITKATHFASSASCESNKTFWLNQMQQNFAWPKFCNAVFTFKRPIRNPLSATSHCIYKKYKNLCFLFQIRTYVSETRIEKAIFQAINGSTKCLKNNVNIVVCMYVIMFVRLYERFTTDNNFIVMFYYTSIRSAVLKCARETAK